MRLSRLALSLTAPLALAASQAAAAPVLIVTPTSVALSPTQTVLSLQVDPNDTPLSGLVFDLSALASGLTIVSVTSLDPDVTAEAPVLSGGDWLAGFSAAFLLADRTAPFDVGTVTVEGLVAGTALVLGGNYTEGAPGFADLPIAPTTIATVVPEPAAAALLAQGLCVLAALRLRAR